MMGDEHVGIEPVVIHDAMPPPGSVGRTQYNPRCGADVAGGEADSVPCGPEAGGVVALMVVSATWASSTVVVPPVDGVAGA